MAKHKKAVKDIDAVVNWHQKLWRTDYINQSQFSKKEHELIALTVAQVSKAVEYFLSEGASNLYMWYSCGHPDGCCVVVRADKYTKITPGKK